MQAGRVVEAGEENLSLIFDGAADGILDVTWWIADTGEAEVGSGGSSGCNAGLPTLALTLFAGAVLAAAGRSQISRRKN